MPWTTSDHLIHTVFTPNKREALICDNKYLLKKFGFPKIYSTTKSSLNTCHNYSEFIKSYYSSMVSLLKESSTGAYKVYYCFILLNLKKYCAKKIQNVAFPKISTYGKSEHFRLQFHKMIKDTQTIRPQFADELFECVWPFCGIGA